MVTRYPKLIRPGRSIDQLTLNIDVAPTLLDFAGMKAPKEMQGSSLLPLLKGQTPKWRDAFFCEYFEEANFPRIATWQAVRNDHWKYIHYPNLQDADELYDVKEDRYEMKNRIKDPAAGAALEMMKREFERTKKETF